MICNLLVNYWTWFTLSKFYTTFLCHGQLFSFEHATSNVDGIMLFMFQQARNVEMIKNPCFIHF